MKIYFGFTVAGDRSAIDTARHLVRLLEKGGHEVLTRHLVDDNAWDKDHQLAAKEIYTRDMNWLEQCDRAASRRVKSVVAMRGEADRKIDSPLKFADHFRGLVLGTVVCHHKLEPLVCTRLSGDGGQAHLQIAGPLIRADDDGNIDGVHFVGAVSMTRWR